MKIIALSGWKTSGKDTAADFIEKNFDYKKLALADELKKSTAKEFDVPLYYFYDQDLKEKPLPQYPVEPKDNFGKNIANMLKEELKSGYWTPRALCILKGSTNRAVNSNFWLNSIINSINKEVEHPTRNSYGKLSKGIVISDLRYKSEIGGLNDFFGNRLITVRISRYSTISTIDPSERDLDDYEFDYTIENKGTIEEFYEKIEKMMADIARK